MSMSLMTPDGELEIPMRGEGVNLELLARMEVFEKELSDLKKTIAAPDTYGLAKVTSATDVTQESGIALSAVQNNATINGTLRYEITEINKKIPVRYLLYQSERVIQENEILNLQSDDYQYLEVHYCFEMSAGTEQVCVIPKGNNIIVGYFGINDSEYDTFVSNRRYIFQTPSSYISGIARLRRFDGTREKNIAWLNILRIYGIKFNS